MRIFLAVLVMLTLAGCGGTKPNPNEGLSPAWYMKQNLPVFNKYEIIGYGEGESFKEAEANAKEDISQRLSSEVDSSISVHSTDKGSMSEAKLKVTSKLNIQNVKTIKREQMENGFFVALKYENLDLAYRVQKTIGNVECKNEEVSSYMKETTLYQSIKKAVECELSVKLQRRNSAWYLTYKEHMFLLSDSEFEQLYTSIQNQKYSFEPSKKVLRDGDEFHFTFSADEDMYVTLLDVYENGIVTLLQASTQFSGDLQIPSKESESYFEAGLVEEGKDTHDLYIAIFTKEPLDISRYEYANEELASSELAYKFDELINFISKYEYASILLRTKK